jgi:hypothetical protein
VFQGVSVLWGFSLASFSFRINTICQSRISIFDARSRDASFSVVMLQAILMSNKFSPRDQNALISACSITCVLSDPIYDARKRRLFDNSTTAFEYFRFGQTLTGSISRKHACARLEAYGSKYTVAKTALTGLANRPKEQHI